MLRTGYDPVLYGNYLLIHGEGEDRSYFYAHMPRPALVHRGERVWAGERVGAVGETGNAITSAATSTSRSTSTASRSTPSPNCAAGTATAERSNQRLALGLSL